MSQPYYIDDQTPAHRPPSQSSNTMGLVGFILSLASLATCGFLSPIAFFISLAGMFRAPRGFAVAGAAISGVTTAVVVGVCVMMYMAGKAGYDEIQKTVDMSQTKNTLRIAATEIENYQLNNDAYPSGVEGNKLILSYKDAWEQPLIYERDEDADSDTYTIRSKGPDGIGNTGDDLTHTPWQDAHDWATDEPSDAAEAAETNPEF